MIRLAGNITLLDWGVPLVRRPERAAWLGLDGVECLFPYAVPLQDLVAGLHSAGLPMVLINTPEPDWAEGGRGSAAIPGQTARFRAGLNDALSTARALDCGMVHVMSGATKDADAFGTLVANLQMAAELAPDLTLTIEPLNAQDMPGYFLNDYDLTARVLDSVDRANVALQFDSWHAARIHGDARAVWARHNARVAHVQISGAKTRGAPDMTSVSERALLEDIASSGFAGWISAEFIPQGGDDPDWPSQLRRVLHGVKELPDDRLSGTRSLG